MNVNGVLGVCNGVWFLFVSLGVSVDMVTLVVLFVHFKNGFCIGSTNALPAVADMQVRAWQRCSSL